MLLCRDSCCTQGEPRGATASTRNMLVLLVDRLGDGVVVIGPDQAVVWMNRAMERLFGVSGYETIGMNAVEFISLCVSPNLQGGEDLKADFIGSCFFCENIPTRRYRISRNPCRGIWVEYSSTVIPSGPNRGARLDTFHVSQDSGRLETNLQEYRQRYDFLETVSSDLVVCLDPGLAIRSVSPSARLLLGYNPGDLAGKHLSSIMTPESIAEFQKACFLDRVSRGSTGRSVLPGNVRTIEATLTDMQRQPVAVIFGFALVGDDEGNPAGTIAVAHRKSGNQSDEHLWQEVCSQFNRNIEHLACLGDRIKNPLAVIIGLAGMQDGAAARQIAEQAQIIDRIVTELDQGYVASLNVRQFLRKHYHLEDDAQPRVTPPKSGSA
ncbi:MULTISPECIES: PAS domain-containing protein [unclassified Methanoculleus]|uniref:PAS domain-containing protein n=3 Tax=Methanoculleus TaxID=45989 RepID=UPI00319EB9F1